MATSKEKSLPRQLSSEELTGHEKLARSYKDLLNQYESKIVQLADNPIKIVYALNNEQVLADELIKPAREYISNLPLQTHQNEALFEILIRSTNYEDLNRIKKALLKSQNTRLKNIFDIIGNRLQAKVDTSVLVKAIVNVSTHKDGPPQDQHIEIDLERLDAGRDTLHKAAIVGDFEAVEDILADPKYNEKKNWLTPGRKESPIHWAARGENSKDSLTFVKTLIKVATSKGIIGRSLEQSLEVVVGGTELLPFQWTIEELINHEDNRGNTALHLAAENKLVQFVEYLCDQGANILKRKIGITPLELMYNKTPAAVVHLLNKALIAGNSNSNDGNLSVKMDFRAIIGSASDDPGKNKAASYYNEMELLANVVFRNKKGSLKSILPHVVVKTFLDLKWKIFRAAILFLSTFYVLIHLWFTYFVIQVFIVEYPFRAAERPLNGTATRNGGQDYEKLTFFSYISGNWKAVPPHVLIDDNNPLPPMIYLQGTTLMIVGILLFLIEVIECNLILKVATGTQRKASGGNIVTGDVATLTVVEFTSTSLGGNYNGDGTNKTPKTKLFNWFDSFVYSVKYYFVRVPAWSAYLASVENVLQLIFIVLMIGVSTVVFQNEISSWYYLCSAFSVVLAWTLILMQTGNIYGVGVYVQIFKTVLWRFSSVMCTYSVILIAFSISFSIIFPEEKLFTTLPASFFRVISMMVGELNFDDIFNKDGEEESLRAFPYASHWIHTGFIVSVTIVLINLLIGLTVSDIEKIFETSDVIHRSIQIERLYIMERLYLDVPIFRWLNRGNIYVVPQEKDREKGQGLQISVRIKELPITLHKEIRLLAENRQEYYETYLQKKT